MFRSDMYGFPPGLTGATETYEQAIRWENGIKGVITGGIISASILDTGNTPTWQIRRGLLLGQKLSDGSWINYSPTATDGSEVAAGVLLTSLRAQDLQGTTQSHFYGILVGGPVKAAALIGLDLMARQQMSEHFQFDDFPYGLVGHHWFPWRRFSSKTADYQVLASDNHTLFDNTGATGAVIFTLPALANGYNFGFHVVADQTVTVASSEGDNLVAYNDASADSVAFSTGGQKIGGGVRVYTNPGATKWIVENISAGANTITVAT